MEKDDLGKPAYDTKKGSFIWGKNVEPQYFWYNGSIKHLTVKNTIDPRGVVKLTEPLGAPDDVNSRIFPFKVHMGKLPYDKVNKTMVIPHLFPKGKTDKEAYWKSFDWSRAITFGMSYAGQPFSGEYDFVETSFVYPTTHMVAPKDNVVACSECHAREGSRLASLSGIYMPAKDSSPIINTIGWVAVLGSLAGVILHALGRIFTAGRREED
jgi:hypothetical protein